MTINDIQKVKKTYDDCDWIDYKHILTNGCFDLFHAGHAQLLEQIEKENSKEESIPVIWVGVDSNESITNLKGKNRPVMDEKDRAYLVESHYCVSHVFLFDDLIQPIKLLKPDIYYKGGDYTLETLDQTERAILEHYGCDIKFLDLKQGISTTKYIKYIKDHYMNI